MTNTKQYEIKNKEEKNKELILEVEINSEFLESQKSKALKELGKGVEVKGFRKGMAPENLVEQEIGEAKIYEEQAFQAVNEILPEILKDEKIQTITHPKISILKLAPKNPLLIKINFILMPEVKLADYKKIAKEIKANEKVEVTEKEVEDYIQYLRESRAQSEKIRKQTSGDTEERKSAEKEVVLPEFNDDFVKTLGNFNNVEEFKKELKINLQKDKEVKAGQKRRVEIIEKIISESKIEMPEILVEEELNKMMGQFFADIKNMKIEPADYLKEIKKTEEDLRNEWKGDAEKRAKMNLILPRIAIEENIKPDQEKINQEVAHVLEHHKDINQNDAKMYFAQIFTNEEVFKFLEKIK